MSKTIQIDFSTITITQQKVDNQIVPCLQEDVNHPYASAHWVTISKYNTMDLPKKIRFKWKDINMKPKTNMNNSCALDTVYAAYRLYQDYTASEYLQQQFPLNQLDNFNRSKNLPTPGDYINWVYSKGKSELVCLGFETALPYWDNILGIILYKPGDPLGHYVLAWRDDAFFIVDNYKGTKHYNDYINFIIFGFIFRKEFAKTQPQLQCSLNTSEDDQIEKLKKKQLVITSDGNLADPNSIDTILNQVTPNNSLYGEYINLKGDNILVLAGTGEGKSRLGLMEAVKVALRNNINSNFIAEENHSICIIAVPLVVIAQQFFEKLCKMTIPYKKSNRIILSKMLTSTNTEGNTLTYHWKKGPQIKIMNGNLPFSDDNKKVLAEVFVGTYEMINLLLTKSTEIKKENTVAVYDEVQHALFGDSKRFDASIRCLRQLQEKSSKIVMLSGTSELYEKKSDVLVNDILKNPCILEKPIFPIISPFNSRSKNIISEMLKDINSEISILRGPMTYQPDYFPDEGIWKIKGFQQHFESAVDAAVNLLYRNFTPFYIAGMTLAQRHNNICDASCLMLVNDISISYQCNILILYAAHLIILKNKMLPLLVTDKNKIKSHFYFIDDPLKSHAFASMYSKSVGSDSKNSLKNIGKEIIIPVRKMIACDECVMDTLSISSHEEGRKYFLLAGCWNSNAQTDYEDEIESAFQKYNYMPPVVVATQKIAVGADFPYLNRVCVMAPHELDSSLIEQTAGRVDRKRKGRLVWIEDNMQEKENILTASNHQQLAELASIGQDSGYFAELTEEERAKTYVEFVKISPAFSTNEENQIISRNSIHLVEDHSVDPSRILTNPITQEDIVVSTYNRLTVTKLTITGKQLLEKNNLEFVMRQKKLRQTIQEIISPEELLIPFYLPYGEVTDYEILKYMPVIFPDYILIEMDKILLGKPAIQINQALAYTDPLYNSIAQTLNKSEGIKGSNSIENFVKGLVSIVQHTPLKEQMFLFAYLLSASKIMDNKTDVKSSDQREEREAARTRPINQKRFDCHKLDTKLCQFILNLVVPNIVEDNTISLKKKKAEVYNWDYALDPETYTAHEEHAFTLLDTMKAMSIGEFNMIVTESKRSRDNNYKLLKTMSYIKSFSKLDNKDDYLNDEQKKIINSSPFLQVIKTLATDLNKIFSLIPTGIVTEFLKKMEDTPGLKDIKHRILAYANSTYAKQIAEYKAKNNIDPNEYQQYKHVKLSELFDFIN